MYPIVPPAFPRFRTDKSGEIRETRIDKTSWNGLPRITADDQGRITRLRANGVELRFEARIPIDLAFHDTSALQGPMVLQGEDYFDTATIHVSTDSKLEASYSNSSSGDVIRVRVEAIQGGESADYFSCTLVSCTLSSSGKTLGAWDFPSMRLRPLSGSNDERMLATQMGLRGAATSAPIQPYPFGEDACIYPNDDNGSGGTTRRALGSTSQLYSPAGMQYHHVYDRDSKAGMLVVVEDGDAHYKVVFQNGTGTAHVCGIRHIPSNGRGRTALATSDPCGSYSVRICPFRGDINDSAKEYRRILLDIVKPQWLPSSRTLDDYRESTVAGWGFGGKRSGMLATSIWWTITQLAGYSEDVGGNRGKKAGGVDGMTTTGSGEGLNETGTMVRVIGAMEKLFAVMGDPDGALFYSTSDEAVFGNRRNDQYTNWGRTLIDYLAGRVTYPVIYTLMHQWCNDSKWMASDDGSDPKYGWRAAIGDPSLSRILDATGVEVTVSNGDEVVDPVTGGTVPASWTELQAAIQFGDSRSRAHVLDLLERRFVVGDPPNGVDPTSASLGGLYLDALTAVFGGEDYRAGLTDDQKGFSSHQSLGMVEMAKELRSSRLKNDFGYFSEWPNEPTGLNLDGVSVSTNPINNGAVVQAPLSLGLFNMVWSERCPRIDFYSSFTTFQSSLDSTPTSYPQQADIWMLTFQHLISHGSVFFVQGEFPNRVDLIPADPDDPTDPSYNQWHTWAEKALSFTKTIADALRLVGAAPLIFGGRMIRELEGTAQANLSDDQLSIVGTEVIGASIHGRAWYVDNPKAQVYVVLTTAEETDQEFTLKMDRGRHPELPSGELELFDMISESVDMTFTDIIDRIVTVPSEGIRIFRIQRA